MAVNYDYRWIWQLKFPTGEVYFDLTDRRELEYESAIRNLLKRSSHPCLQLNELAITSPYYEVNLVAKVHKDYANELLATLVVNRYSRGNCINAINGVRSAAIKDDSVDAKNLRKLVQQLKYKLKQAYEDYDALVAQYKELEASK
jgi:hypothetical protein